MQPQEQPVVKVCQLEIMDGTVTRRGDGHVRAGGTARRSRTSRPPNNGACLRGHRETTSSLSLWLCGERARRAGDRMYTCEISAPIQPSGCPLSIRDLGRACRAVEADRERNERD